jgi:hypothetical protein
MGAAQRRHARRVVTVAQNTVEWWRYVRKWRLGFSLVFAKIPHEGSPIYSSFAPQLCVTRIQLRSYLQSTFELGFGWDFGWGRKDRAQ